MDLSTVHQGVHKLKKKKRVGRGPGSGHGKTASRGSKGQWASAGAKKPTALFEGGQMQLFRRMPKRGFSHATWDKDYLVVNVGDIDKAFEDGASVDPAALRWWEALGTLKWGVICVGQSFTHLSGLVRSVELATLGRRVAETEWDLLQILDGGW